MHKNEFGLFSTLDPEEAIIRIVLTMMLRLTNGVDMNTIKSLLWVKHLHQWNTFPNLENLFTTQWRNTVHIRVNPLCWNMFFNYWKILLRQWMRWNFHFQHSVGGLRFPPFKCQLGVLPAGKIKLLSSLIIMCSNILWDITRDEMLYYCIWNTIENCCQQWRHNAGSTKTNGHEEGVFA